MKFLKSYEDYQDVPQIVYDNYFRKCLELAKTSKSDGQRYGAILVKNNEILGEGFNRAIVHKYFKLDRIIKQGYANHAEVESMNDALQKGNDIKGADIYVAGYFTNTKTIFFKNIFTCPVCIPYFKQYGISNIYTPTPNGWIKRSVSEAEKDALAFKANRLDNRLNVLIGDYKIDLL